MTDWASLIRRVRRHRMMTQTDLATSLGVSQGTVSRWESGHFEPELRFQTMLRDFLRANRPDLETRMLQSVQMSPTAVCLMEVDGTIIAASQKIQTMLEFQAGPAKPKRYPLERRSPGARKVLTRQDVSAWLFDVATISFHSGLVTPSGKRCALRQLWTPFLLDGLHTVIRKDVEVLPSSDDDDMFDEDPAIQVLYLEDLN